MQPALTFGLHYIAKETSHQIFELCNLLLKPYGKLLPGWWKIDSTNLHSVIG